MKPNIFSIATKELSQDAFIAWLLKWADPITKQYNAELHQCGIAFLKALLAKKEIELSADISKIDVQRQYHSIDVYATVTLSNSEIYIIVIEDKVSSGQHDNQLERYKLIAEKHAKEIDAQVILIYTKTRFESLVTLNKALADGYSIFGFRDFVDFFEANKAKNDVYIDFCENIKVSFERYNLYSQIPIAGWNENCEIYTGFFNELESRNIINSWEYVDSRSGGFMVGSVNWSYWGKYPIHLQLENNIIAFRVNVEPSKIVNSLDTDQKKSIRNYLFEMISQKTVGNNAIKVNRPGHFGIGNTMISAYVRPEDWLGNPDELVNIDSVIANLKKYKDFLNECTQQPVPEKFNSWVS